MTRRELLVARMELDTHADYLQNAANAEDSPLLVALDLAIRLIEDAVAALPWNAE